MWKIKAAPNPPSTEGLRRARGSYWPGFPSLVEFQSWNRKSAIGLLQRVLDRLQAQGKIKEVRPRLAYLDTGDVYPPAGQELVFIQADVKRLKALWAKRTKEMLSDTTFAPKPNRFCGSCHYRASNGGPCSF